MHQTESAKSMTDIWFDKLVDDSTSRYKRDELILEKNDKNQDKSNVYRDFFSSFHNNLDKNQKKEIDVIIETEKLMKDDAFFEEFFDNEHIISDLNDAKNEIIPQVIPSNTYVDAFVDLSSQSLILDNISSSSSSSYKIDVLNGTTLIDSIPNNIDIKFTSDFGIFVSKGTTNDVSIYEPNIFFIERPSMISNNTKDSSNTGWREDHPIFKALDEYIPDSEKHGGHVCFSDYRDIFKSMKIDNRNAKIYAAGEYSEHPAIKKSRVCLDKIDDVSMTYEKTTDSKKDDSDGDLFILEDESKNSDEYAKSLKSYSIIPKLSYVTSDHPSKEVVKMTPLSVFYSDKSKSQLTREKTLCIEYSLMKDIIEPLTNIAPEIKVDLRNSKTLLDASNVINKRIDVVDRMIKEADECSLHVVDPCNSGIYDPNNPKEYYKNYSVISNRSSHLLNNRYITRNMKKLASSGLHKTNVDICPVITTKSGHWSYCKDKKKCISNKSDLEKKIYIKKSFITHSSILIEKNKDDFSFYVKNPPESRKFVRIHNGIICPLKNKRSEINYIDLLDSAEFIFYVLLYNSHFYSEQKSMMDDGSVLETELDQISDLMVKYFKKLDTSECKEDTSSSLPEVKKQTEIIKEIKKIQPEPKIIEIKKSRKLKYVNKKYTHVIHKINRDLLRYISSVSGRYGIKLCESICNLYKLLAISKKCDSFSFREVLSSIKILMSSCLDKRTQNLIRNLKLRENQAKKIFSLNYVNILIYVHCLYIFVYEGYSYSMAMSVLNKFKKLEICVPERINNRNHALACKKKSRECQIDHSNYSYKMSISNEESEFFKKIHDADLFISTLSIHSILKKKNNRNSECLGCLFLKKKGLLKYIKLSLYYYKFQYE